MADFRITEGELFYEQNLGKPVELVKNILKSYSENSNGSQLYIDLANEILISAFKNLDKDKLEKYFDRTKKFKKGYDIAVKKMIAGEGIHYFIKDRHLGDAARTLSLISVFKKYHTKNKTFPVKKIVVITFAPIADLASVYPDIDEFIILSKPELSDLEYFLKNCNSKDYNFYLDEDVICSKLIRTYLLPDDISFANDMLRLPSKLSDASIENAKKVLEEYNAVPSKTVVFLPHSYSSSSLPEELLTKAIGFFKQMGYTIFTNAGSINEATLSGTHRLNVPPTTVLALGHMGCLMIGAQCGMMDLMRWFKININCMIVFLLLSKNDITYSKNRGLSDPITHFETVTYIMLDQNETEQLSDNIIREAQYFIKGDMQNDLEAKCPYCNIFHANDLNQYVSELVKVKHTVIFISAYDSADRFWEKFEGRHMLGLKEDLSKKWRLSYTAVIDADNNVCTERLSDQWDGVSHQYYFDDIFDNTFPSGDIRDIPRGNNCWLYSCGMDSQRYTKSSIWINGVDHSLSKRGLNIVVYSKKQCCVIDSITVDLFGDKTLSVKRKKDL